jgi:hypothetical protein
MKDEIDEMMSEVEKYYYLDHFLGISHPNNKMKISTLFIFIFAPHFLHFLLFLSTDNESKCQIDMSRKMDGRRQNPQPLLIQSGTSKFFHPTDRSGVLRMKRNDKIELFCTNGFALKSTYLSDIVDDNRNSVTITCSDGNDGFRIDEESGDDVNVNLVRRKFL